MARSTKGSRGRSVQDDSAPDTPETESEQVQQPARPTKLTRRSAAKSSPSPANADASKRSVDTAAPASGATRGPKNDVAATTASKSRQSAPKASEASPTQPAKAAKPGAAAAFKRRFDAKAPGDIGPAASTRASDATQATPMAEKPAKEAGQQGTEQRTATTAAGLLGNLERIESLSQRLIAALANRPPPNPGVDGPGADLYTSAASAWMKLLAEQPSRVIEQQVNFWGETLRHYTKTQVRLAKGKLEAHDDDGPSDKRFANPLWATHPYFNYVKQQYRINAKAIRAAAADLDIPDQVARRRMEWLVGQVIDMMAPTNFLATNPDALEKAVETEGESLVRGLENLVRDVESNHGDLVVSLADRDAFTVGQNIGTTEGKVVHRAPLFELIQYHPLTEKVHALPIVIFPPWINKFYILDLKPQNSLIRWLVKQGHSVFVVSWKNPDASFADTGMEDYVSAYLDATDQVLRATQQKKLNIVGYCIAGTTLAATLGVLKQRGDTRVNSATFFTTLTDFSDLGEFVTFLQPDFVKGIHEEVSRRGLFPAQLMSRTMSFLRANDLVWGPAIRNYMMGETPPAFDLLYWNGDSTNLPGRMTLDYIDGLCIANRLPRDGFEVLGHRVSLADVNVPLCSVACENDHIAPWKDCWKGVAQMASKDKTFILSESGHIAGIVNPPSKMKYGHYAGSTNFSDDHQVWKDESQFATGSWWPVWGEWLTDKAGEMVAARQLDSQLQDAPGDYVHERAT